MQRLTALTCAVLMLVTALGCSSTPVADDLAQRDANEIIAVLQERGIAGYVSKGRGSGARYSVYVGSGSFAEAASILNRLGLPPEKKATFEEMTAASGIIPSSREVEALRLDRALAAQVEDLLKARSDVASATVVVQHHALGGRGKAAVSVIVQRRIGASLQDAEVRDIITHSVVGVSKDDVFVSIVDAPSLEATPGISVQGDQNRLVPFLRYWQVPAGEYNGLALLFVIISVVAAGLAGLAGYIVGQFTGIKRESVSPFKGGARRRTSSNRNTEPEELE